MRKEEKRADAGWEKKARKKELLEEYLEKRAQAKKQQQELLDEKVAKAEHERNRNKVVDRQGVLWYDRTIKVQGKQVEEPFGKEKNRRTETRRIVTANPGIPIRRGKSTTLRFSVPGKALEPSGQDITAA